MNRKLKKRLRAAGLWVTTFVLMVIMCVPGLWVVEVAGFNVPEGPQSFSLCFSPNFVGDCNTNTLIVTIYPPFFIVFY